MRRRCVNLFYMHSTSLERRMSLSILLFLTTPHCVSSPSSVVRLDYASCLSVHVVALRPNRGRVLLFFPSPRGCRRWSRVELTDQPMHFLASVSAVTENIAVPRKMTEASRPGTVTGPRAGTRWRSYRARGRSFPSAPALTMTSTNL